MTPPFATLSPLSWRRIYAGLAAKLGCQESALRDPGVSVLAHGADLATYRGIYIWAMLGPEGEPRACVVSAPPDLVEQGRAAIASAPPQRALDPGLWREALGNRVERAVGPSYQGYVDGEAFRPLAAGIARPLRSGERDALERLARACSGEEWAHSAIQPDHEPVFVVSEGDGLPLAAASLTRDGAGMVSVGVITRPDARGRGHGRAVVSALTAWALAHGETVHYQTLRANARAVAIARSLGFQEIAGALAVRLRGS